MTSARSPLDMPPGSGPNSRPTSRLSHVSGENQEVEAEVKENGEQKSAKESAQEDQGMTEETADGGEVKEYSMYDIFC